MAIYHSAIFDSLRNKLSNTVLYKKGPDGIIRTRPAKVKNPRTADQQLQRARMKVVIELSRRFAPIIVAGFCNRPIRLSVYNMFTKLNVMNVEVDDQFRATPEMKKLVVSDGVLQTPNISMEKAGNSIKFTGNPQSADGLSAGDDNIYAGLYCETAQASRLHKIGTRAKGGSTEFVLPEGWNLDTTHVYVFAVSRSKKRTSPTLYLE